MSGAYGLEYDFPLFDPNTFSTEAEKKLIDRLLKAQFIDDPWLRRRLASYVLAETWERDRIVLQVLQFFFRGKFHAELLGIIRELDSVLAALGKRGHFVHQFEVLVFGWALISMLVDSDPEIQKMFGFLTPREVLMVWLTASVVHDFGYPLQMGSKVMKKLCTWYDVLGMTELAELHKSTEEQYESERAEGLARVGMQVWSGLDVNSVLLEALQEALLVDRTDAERLVEGIQTNHGCSAAVVLCLKCFQSWESEGTTIATPGFSMNPLKLAMAAICLHDLPDTHKRYIGKIDFHRNPYAWMLFLVDNLQDWNRDLRPNEEWPSYNLVRVHEEHGGLGLSYVLTHEKWTPTLEEKAVKSIEEKSQRLQLIARPDPQLNFQIKASFRTSHGIQLEPIDIQM
jgi:hypothetical protein